MTTSVNIFLEMRITRIILMRRWAMRFREIEKILLADGWVYKNSKGSHCQYVHPKKSGKVTVPNHPGDIAPQIVKQIFKQAGL